MDIIDYFEKYTSQGWNVIALHAKSKKPVFRKWNKQYNKFIHQSYLVKNPESNIALKLGKIIDLESDTEQGNKILEEWLKNDPHMKYKSKRGYHHLFLNPFQNLKKIIIKGIEFRGHGHCSVLPPSVSSEGIKYTWDENSSEYLTELPTHIKKIIRQYYSSPEVISSICNKCKCKFNIHEKRLKKEIFVFKQMNQNWYCKKCRTIDIRKLCRKLKTKKSLKESVTF